MSNIVNIFNTLPQGASDSEDEGHQDTNVQTQKNQNRKQQNRNQEEKPNRTQQDTRQQDKQSSRQQDKKGQEAKQNKTGVQGDLSNKEERDYHNHHKDFHKQQKDDLDKPHPNDRHSGSNTHAYGGKPKKGGAGKANWGVGDEQGESPVKGDQNKETETGKPKEEEKEALTLQEYLQQQRRVQNEPQVNEAKAKITSEQLMKEMGTATLLKGRQQQEIDDRKAGKKKERLDVDHHAAINTEHATLLQFRTGFIEKEFKPRAPEDGEFKKFGPRTGGKKHEDKKEENQNVQAGTEEQAGENQTTQQENTVAQGEENQERRYTQGTHEGRGGYRGRRGGYRGGNRGYGGYYNEHREHGDRAEGRFEGDEQGEQGTSTGYTYKGGYRGNRGYGGNQGRYRQRDDQEGRGGYGGEQGEQRGQQQYQRKYEDRGGYGGEQGEQRQYQPRRNQEQRGDYGGEQGEQRGQQQYQRKYEDRGGYGGEQGEQRGQQQYQPRRNQEERGAYRGGRGGYNKQGDKPAFKISDEAFPKLG